MSQVTESDVAELIESHAQSLIDETATIRQTPGNHETNWERLRLDARAILSYLNSMNKERL